MPQQHTDSNTLARDLFIIDAHLKKALASSQTACRLHSRGQVTGALAQNKLTRVFLHNALARLEQPARDTVAGATP